MAAVNEKLDRFKSEIVNKKVAVLGIGISNTPLIKYLARIGAEVSAFDMASPEKLSRRLKELEGLSINYYFGEDYLESLSGYDVIFKTPSMRHDIPQIEAERKKGAEITTEMNVFMELCPAKVFGVTGSDGKTTTTTMIYEILKEEGYNCWLGGNVGTPLLDRIDEIDKDDLVVLELSSFQLMTVDRSPDVAVITNISPNHLDIHKSMEEYVSAKKNIYRYQNESNLLVLNMKDETAKISADEAVSQVIYFNAGAEVETGVFQSREKILWNDCGKREVLTDTDEFRIPGNHNVENLMAASAATARFVKPESIRNVTRSFNGVEHRLEPVRNLHGIRFYNDSIASSPTRTIAGLKSFKEKLILIAGGKDKKNDYNELGKAIFDGVKCLVLTGETADSIEESYMKEVERRGCRKTIDVFRCKNLEDAVAVSFLQAKPGDVILLSPASTSFDKYDNFEKRGKHFKELVSMLS